jgi:hypothetical protein
MTITGTNPLTLSTSFSNLNVGQLTEFCLAVSNCLNAGPGITLNGNDPITFSSTFSTLTPTQISELCAVIVTCLSSGNGITFTGTDPLVISSSFTNLTPGQITDFCTVVNSCLNGGNGIQINGNNPITLTSSFNDLNVNQTTDFCNVVNSCPVPPDPILQMTSSMTPTSIFPGDTATIEIVVENIEAGSTPTSDVMIEIPFGFTDFTYVPGSLTVDGTNNTTDDSSIGGANPKLVVNIDDLNFNPNNVTTINFDINGVSASTQNMIVDGSGGGAQNEQITQQVVINPLDVCNLPSFTPNSTPMLTWDVNITNVLPFVNENNVPGMLNHSTAPFTGGTITLNNNSFAFVSDITATTPQQAISSNQCWKFNFTTPNKAYSIVNFKSFDKRSLPNTIANNYFSYVSTDPTFTTFTVIIDVAGNSFLSNSGLWRQSLLATPIDLQPNTTYYFAFGGYNSSNYIQDGFGYDIVCT